MGQRGDQCPGDRRRGSGETTSPLRGSAQLEAHRSKLLRDVERIRAELPIQADACFEPLCRELESSVQSAGRSPALSELYRKELAAVTTAQKDIAQILAKRVTLLRRQCDDLRQEAETRMAAERDSGSGRVAATGGRDAPIRNRLDLHGLRYEEAKREADRFLRQAHQDGELRVVVIHGKGIHSRDGSVLHEGMPVYLANHQLVERTESGGLAEGGDGVTLAYLRRDILPARTSAVPTPPTSPRLRRKPGR